MPPIDPKDQKKPLATGVSAHTATPKPSTEEASAGDKKDQKLREEGMKAHDVENLSKDTPDKQRATAVPLPASTYGTRTTTPGFRVVDPIRADRQAARAFDPKNDPQKDKLAEQPTQSVTEKDVVQHPSKTGPQVMVERPYVSRENVPAGTHPASQEKAEKEEHPVRKTG